MMILAKIMWIILRNILHTCNAIQLNEMGLRSGQERGDVTLGMRVADVTLEA